MSDVIPTCEMDESEVKKLQLKTEQQMSNNLTSDGILGDDLNDVKVKQEVFVKEEPWHTDVHGGVKLESLESNPEEHTSVPDLINDEIIKKEPQMNDFRWKSECNESEIKIEENHVSNAADYYTCGETGQDSKMVTRYNIETGVQFPEVLQNQNAEEHCLDSYDVEINHQMIFRADNGTYECSLCRKIYQNKYSCTRHVRNHSEETPYACDICGKAFKVKTILVTHKISHLDEKQYRCETCKMAFKLKHQLVQHQVCHSDERPFICGACMKGFESKRTLDKHILSHSNARPHTCNLCGKSFKTKCNLDKHGATHSDERLHKCDKCLKAFKRKDQLNQHWLCHTNVRLYKCDKCPKSFKHQKLLVQHMKSHSKLKFYHCETCGTSLTNKISLYHHMVSHQRRKLHRKRKVLKTF